MMISVLFTRTDSNYLCVSNCETWDYTRNALTFTGTQSVIAHPPCRAWGRLRRFANPLPGEKELAIFAINLVRKNKGIVEHPAFSSLWSHMGLPRPGDASDEFGGWTLSLNQCDFGHKAEKSTWLYIVGINRDAIPEYGAGLGVPTHCIRASKTNKTPLPNVSKAEREHTPLKFAQWLVDLCHSISI